MSQLFLVEESVSRTDRRSIVAIVCSRDPLSPDTQPDPRLLFQLQPGTLVRVPCLTTVHCGRASNDQRHCSNASIFCNSSAALPRFRLPGESTPDRATEYHRKRVSDQYRPKDRCDLV